MSWTTITDISPIAWYKAETLAATYANGDPISMWADSSGNSRDLTASGTTRPLAAASSINGYMAASFDGIDDVLSSGSYTVGGKTYVCIAFNYASNSDYNGLISIDGNSTPTHVCDFLTCYGYSTGNWLVGRGTPSVSFLNYYGGKPGVPVPATDTIVSTSASVDGLLLRSNGKTTYAGNGSATLATPTGTGYIHVGNVGSFGNTSINGDIVEIVIWEDTVDTTVIWVEGYLANKYSIALADGHLFKNAAPTSAPPIYNAAGGGVRIPNIRGGADQ